MNSIEYLRNYVTLECVYSKVFWFESGKHYLIRNVTPTSIEIESNFNDAVTFNIKSLNGKYTSFIPGHKKLI